MTGYNKFDILFRFIRGEPVESVAKEAGVKPEEILEWNKNQGFEYSAEWYDRIYHLGAVGVDRRTWAEINQAYIDHGYRERLNSILDDIYIPNQPFFWLEVGCHLGLTANWIAERYPNVQLYMMDFSAESIKWCQSTFPFPERAVIWQASADCIQRDGEFFKDKFSMISCLDVTEHLPDPVYKKMITEFWRVLKPYGYLLLEQGDTEAPAHIHVLPEDQLVLDFLERNFRLRRAWLSRYYLLQKIIKKEEIQHSFIEELRMSLLSKKVSGDEIK